jgi:flagellar basal-body rod modification protein FlgD
MTTTTAIGAQATAAATTATATGKTLSGDFNTFLKLLTTQLKNQDPSSPLDTNQFTQQLVQFANVEQQINTNGNLTTLIDLNRASSLYQSAAMIGHQIGADSTQLALQGGTAGLQFTLPTAQPVTISLANQSGVEVYTTTVDGAAGTNGWTWNGTTKSGQTAPDGVYNVKVSSGTGSKATLPFTVTGTATAVSMNGSTPTVSLGPLDVAMSAVRGIIR